MCYITATEFKTHLGHYLELAKHEDIYITKNNKLLVKLSSCQNDALDEFFDFCDELKNEKDHCPKEDDDKLLLEEIKRRCGF